MFPFNLETLPTVARYSAEVGFCGCWLVVPPQHTLLQFVPMEKESRETHRDSNVSFLWGPDGPEAMAKTQSPNGLPIPTPCFEITHPLSGAAGLLKFSLGRSWAGLEWRPEAGKSQRACCLSRVRPYSTRDRPSNAAGSVPFPSIPHSGSHLLPQWGISDRAPRKSSESFLPRPPGVCRFWLMGRWGNGRDGRAVSLHTAVSSLGT